MDAAWLGQAASHAPPRWTGALVFLHMGRTRGEGRAAVRAETIGFFFSCGGFTQFSLLCTDFSPISFRLL
jgi:hypothetical protein